MRSVTRNVVIGTNDGPYMGYLPLVACSKIHVFDVRRIVDGLVVEHWGVPDCLGVLYQLGAASPPAPSKVP